MISPSFSTKALTLRWKQRISALSNGVIRAEQTSAFAAKQAAIRLSHGPLSTQQLQRLASQVNHGRGLYSTASPMPPASPAIINIQKGQFARSWMTRLVTTADGTSFTLWNIAPYARFMLGTIHMMGRPILQKVVEMEQAARVKRLIDAKRRALK